MNDNYQSVKLYVIKLRCSLPVKTQSNAKYLHAVMRIAKPQIHLRVWRPSCLDALNGITAEPSDNWEALFIGETQPELLAGPQDQIRDRPCEAKALMQSVAL